MKRVFSILASLFCAHAFAAPVDATCDVAITAVPFAITQPGRYCLAQNVQASGTGIQISIGASNVDLDLNGRSLACTSRQNGIASIAAAANVRIRNGGVRGCNHAVNLKPCQGCRIDGLTLIDNMLGIYAEGDGLRIERNSFHQIALQSGSSGIFLAAHSSVVQDNLISAASTGIVNHLTKGNVIRGNHFGRCGIGIQFNAAATYQDNLTSTCNVPFAGSGLATSTDAGGNR